MGATGDCNGEIHIWNLQQSQLNQNTFSVEPYYTSEYSVEDIQWSPTESTVLCSAECHGAINVYDVRCKGKSMLHCLVHHNYSDVNVIAWNQKVTNLLASGSDDGVFSVWDLRSFEQPLARFQPCKKPITSIEWHPTDESMILVSDEDVTYVYDLSVEVDHDEPPDDNIPPQMLFMHCGNTFTKEVHWHK